MTAGITTVGSGTALALAVAKNGKTAWKARSLASTPSLIGERHPRSVSRFSVQHQ